MLVAYAQTADSHTRSQVGNLAHTTDYISEKGLIMKQRRNLTQAIVGVIVYTIGLVVFDMFLEVLGVDQFFNYLFSIAVFAGIGVALFLSA